MSKLNLENAKKILAKHTTEAHLFTHAAAVSAAMGAMAYKFGEDKEYWQAIGYLHDVDYEKFPEEHCKHVRELLAGEEVDDEDIANIISHGYGMCTDEVEPFTNIQKSSCMKHSTGFHIQLVYLVLVMLLVSIRNQAAGTELDLLLSFLAQVMKTHFQL